MRTLKLIPIAMIAVLLSSYGFAQPNKTSPQGNKNAQQHQKPPKFDFSTLDLSKDQESQIKTLEEEHMVSTKAIHENLKKKEKLLEENKKEGEVNMDELSLRLKEICDFKTDLMIQREMFHKKIRNILTSEQCKKFDELRPPKPVRQH